MPTFPITFPIEFGGTETPYDVAGTLINDAALEMGLAPSATADPYASSNPLYVQLRAMLKKVGRKLWRMHAWSQLQWVHTFTTTAAEGDYALPENYGRMLSDTAWNLSQTQGVAPLSPQSWRAARAAGVVSQAPIHFRVRQQQFQLLTEGETEAGQEIAYEFLSRFWAQTDGDAGTDGPDKDAPTAATDTIWFDPLLVVAALKAEYLRAKSLPGAQEAEDDFRDTFLLTVADDVPGVTLSLVPADSVRLIDGGNTPDRGFGS